MTTTFSFLLIIIATSSLPSANSAVIHDTSGNNLLSGVPYYILPLLRGSGGGLSVTHTTKNKCPLHVTQEPFEVNNGVPFTFTPIILNDLIIRQAYPISIQADVINPCTGSNIWKVTTSPAKLHVAVLNKKKHHKDDDDDDDDDKDDDDKDDGMGQLVTTGGEFNKGESCFQVVEDNMMPGLESYQIQNCPFKCERTSSSSKELGLTCYNIGIVTDDDGNRYLGRTDAVFPVVFMNSYYSAFSQILAKVSADRKNNNNVE